MNDKMTHMMGGALHSPDDKRDYKISRCMDMPAGGADTVVPRNFECWIPERFYNQGSVGSCTAFAMATIFSCIWHKLTGEDRDFSTGFIYGNTFDNPYPGYGAYMRDVVKTVGKHGDILASIADNNTEKPEAFTWFESVYPEVKEYSKLLIKGYVRLYDDEEIRAFMYKYKIPLFVSMRMGEITPLTSDKDALHAVTMYSYTFNFGFNCKNSWGKYSCPYITNKRAEKFDEIWGIIPNEELVFPDVEEDRWSAKSIDFATTHSLVQGYPDNTFKPEDGVTREQLAVVLERYGRYMDEQYTGISNAAITETETIDFSDVNEDRWSCDGINYASQRALMIGFPDGTFQPEELVTREQLFTVLERYDAYNKLSYKTANTTPTTKNDTIKFPDVSEKRWSYSGIKFGIDTGLATGFPDGTFQPEWPVTREQLCTILERYSEYNKDIFIAIKN